MDPILRETLDLAVRWLHLIAGIMWIGNSMLFNWLDRNLIKRQGDPERKIGEIWLLHSGGFYQVEKKQLAPSEMPEILHWFKWQAYTTWMSGFFLLAIVYYLGGRAFLVDPQVADLSHGTAVALSLGLLAGGWLVYDLLWRTLGNRQRLATALSLMLVAAFVYGVTHLFTARAAYIHVGVLLGSLMAGNVFMHIVPSQKQMVAATQAGQMADPALGARAKTRSIHNNYMTFPVLFAMVSNHFPSTWGNELNWLILGVLILGGATVRHFLNIRFHFPRWLPALLTTVVLTLGTLVYLVTPRSTGQVVNAAPAVDGIAVNGMAPERITFPIVRAVIDQRCTACHAAKPTDPVFASAPAGGIMLDTPEHIRAQAERIKFRAVVTKTMPLANKTGITPIERELLGRWIDEGAHID